MNRQEISAVQAYLRRVFRNDGIALTTPKKASEPVEVWLDGEFIGTLYRDEEDGEVSYDFNMTILEIDLPGRA